MENTVLGKISNALYEYVNSAYLQTCNVKSYYKRNDGHEWNTQ